VSIVSARNIVCLYVCQEVAATADVAAMWNSLVYNSGFVAVRPTRNSERLYRTMKSMTIESATKYDDQQVLYRAINLLRKQNTGLRLTVLNENRFLCGRDYFEKQRRWFAPNDGHNCDETKQDSSCAVVVHNNWIFTKAAKVYRFREHLMWMYDGDDQYYTSNTRLYMTYVNQAPKQHWTAAVVESEISALKTAMTIGYLLNRTVILPRFHNGSEAFERPLNAILHIGSFDKYFAGHYRENSFLRHPKVPPDVKSGLSEKLAVDNFGVTHTPRQRMKISDTVIGRQLGEMRDKVLMFENLHDVQVLLGKRSSDIAFINKTHRAFFRSEYNQKTSSAIA